MNAVTFTQTATAQKPGEYKMTTVDSAKSKADFLLMSVSPNFIQWANGGSEIVSNKTLKSLQAKYNWATDF